MKHRWTRPLTVLALVAVAGLVPARAEPANGFHLEQRLPASTLVFAGAEDIASWPARIGETGLGKLMADEEVRAFLEPLEAMVMGLVEQQLSELPPIVLDLAAHLQNVKGQASIALVGIDEQSGMPQAVASLDFGDHVAEFLRFVTTAKEELDPEGRMIQTTEVGGRAAWILDAEDFMVYASHVDTAFVLATDAQLLEQVLAGPVENSLADDATFQRVRAHVGGAAAGLHAYAAVARAVEQFEHMMPREVAQMAAVLGLDTVHGAGYGMTVKAGGFQDTLYVHAPDADHGLLPMIRMKPLTRPTTLDLVPSKAFLWAEANPQLSQIIGHLRAVMQHVDPGAAAELEEGLQYVNSMLGVDLENEVLAGLQDKIALYGSFPETGGLFPELALILQAKDPAGYAAVLDRVALGITGALNEEGDVVASTRTMEYHGVRMHLFEMQMARGDDPLPFTPTWAFFGDRIVFTLVPYTMKEIILRKETGGPGLETQEDFRALMSAKPEGAGSMSYFDMQGAAALLYDTGVPLLQMLAKPNVLGGFEVDWAKLPPVRRILPYLGSMAEFVTADDQGLAITYNSPIPLMPVYAGTMAASLVFMTVGGVRESHTVTIAPLMPGEVDGIEDEMNLQLATVQAEMLVESVRMYQLENGGNLPDDLGALQREGLMGALPSDPWGGDYVLRRFSGTKRFQILSAGPDRVFDTRDDVVLP